MMADAPTPATPDLDRRLSSLNRRGWLWVALLVGVLALFIKSWWIPGPDASGYISIARHMSRGELARFDSRHLHYAPGYPLLIAPAFWTGDRPFLVISIIQFLLGASVVVGVHHWFRRLVPEASGMLTALVVLNAGFIVLYMQTLSETAFLAELMGAAYLLHRAGAAASAPAAALWAALAVALLTLATWTRHVGCFLAAGFAASMAARAWRGEMRWRRALGLAGGVALPVALALAALLAWQADRARAAGVTEGQTQQLRDAAQQFPAAHIEGLRLRISECGRLIVPGMFKSYSDRGQWLNVNLAIYLAVAAALLVGWWRAARRTLDPLVLALPLYTAFYVSFPLDPGTRYMTPMLPVLLLSAWMLVEPRARRLRIVTAFLVAHLAVGAFYGVREMRHSHCHEHWARLDQMSRSIGDGPVVSQTKHSDRISMLQVAANREIQALPTAARLPRSARWLIVDETGETPAGFLEVDRGAGLRVLRKAGD